MARTSWHHRTPLGRLVSGLVVAAALAVSPALAVHAQQNQFQVFIAAADASGMPVTDLKAEDISFAEAGMPGKVAKIEPHKVPLKVVISLDNGKESTRALEIYRKALNGFVDALPPDVEVSLITTGGSPRTHVKFTADRGVLKKGISSFGPDNDESARFTDSMVEYSKTLEKDVKDKKLTYSPVFLAVSLAGDDVTQYQPNETQKAMMSIANNGGRVFMVSTTTQVADSEANDQVKNGRQAVIGGQLAKVSRGAFEPIQDFTRLTATLAEWGKQLGAVHAKQIAQYRVTLERPASASGQLNPQNLELRITRQGVNGSVSGDGRF